MEKTRNSLLERRRALMGSAYRLFYEEPVHLVRGEGVWLWDARGDKYLDMYNNVAHVGHCHPRVVEAICRQAALLNTHTRYLHEHVVDLAGRLTALLPAELDTAMFCCTGSEANELALRIARTATDATGIIVTDFAYHGNTQAIYEITTESCPPAQRPDHVVTVPVPDTYRGAHRGADAGVRYASYLHEAVRELASRGLRPAAFIIDTIVSSGGVVTPPPGYLGAAAAIVREAGGLFIADEVQPGFGRTGRRFWGFEADDVGHPVSAVVARAELVAEFGAHGRYFNTFGGNPVSCAAALAVLDVIEEDALLRNALDVGTVLADGLMGLAESHECIGDVRANGLFIAVELVADRERRSPATQLTGKVVNGLRKHGVLTGSIGPDDNILKLRPPMVLAERDADYFIGVLDEVLTGTA